MYYTDVMPPTPHYNASLLWEMGGAKRHLEDLYTSINDCPAIREAILLFRVWAKQREMNQVLCVCIHVMCVIVICVH